MHSQRPRSVWDAVKDEHMIDVLIELRRSGATGHWTAGDWDFVSNLMQQRFSQTFSRVQLVNRFRILRRYWRIVNTLRQRPGFDFDEKDLRLTAPDSAWEHFKDHWYPSDRPLIANVQRSCVPLFPKLCIIWPSRRSKTDDHDFDSDGNDDDDEMIHGIHISALSKIIPHGERNKRSRKDLDTDGNSGAEGNSSAEDSAASDSDEHSRSPNNTWDPESSRNSNMQSANWASARNSSPSQQVLNSTLMSSGSSAPSSSTSNGFNLRSSAGKSGGIRTPESSNSGMSNDLTRKAKVLRPTTVKNTTVETRASARNAAAAAAAAANQSQSANAAAPTASKAALSSNGSSSSSSSSNNSSSSSSNNNSSVPPAAESRQIRSSSTAPVLSSGNNGGISAFSTLRRSSRSNSQNYNPFSQQQEPNNASMNAAPSSIPAGISTRSLASATNGFNDSSFASQPMLTSTTAVGSSSDDSSTSSAEGDSATKEQSVLTPAERTVARLMARIGHGILDRFPQLGVTKEALGTEVHFVSSPDGVKIDHIESALEWILARLNKPVENWIVPVDDDLLTLAATAFATPHIATIFLKLPEKNRLSWLQRYLHRVGLRYALN